MDIKIFVIKTIIVKSFVLTIIDVNRNDINIKIACIKQRLAIV